MFLVELIASSFFDLISKRDLWAALSAFLFFFFLNTQEFAIAPLEKMSTKKKVSA